MKKIESADTFIIREALDRRVAHPFKCPLTNLFVEGLTYKEAIYLQAIKKAKEGNPTMKEALFSEGWTAAEIKAVENIEQLRAVFRGEG